MENTFCNWAVCYDIDGRFYDDRKPRTVIASILRYPLDAQRFIAEFVPEETRSRFYVKRLSNCMGEFE